MLTEHFTSVLPHSLSFKSAEFLFSLRVTPSVLSPHLSILLPPSVNNSKLRMQSKELVLVTEIIYYFFRAIKYIIKDRKANKNIKIVFSFTVGPIQVLV